MVMVWKEEEDEEEIETKDFPEITLDFKLTMTRRLLEKLDCLSTDYPNEVCGLLTYSKMDKDEIILDDILIPPQKVTSATVDLDGDDLVAMRREYKDKCLKIVGHFHSHQSMGAFFSDTDEKMMKQYSENKNVCIFIVGSNGTHKIRVVMNEPFKISIENVPYQVEPDENIRKEMEEEIKNKVKISKVETTTIKVVNVDVDIEKKAKKEIQSRIKYFQHRNHTVVICKMFRYYADLIEEEFKTLNPKVEKDVDNKDEFTVIVELGKKDKAKEFMVDVKKFLLDTLLKESEVRLEKKEKQEEDEENRYDNLNDYLDEEEELYLEAMKKEKGNRGYINYDSYIEDRYRY
jgi:proteasome lid subunit RPN8/RPN11